MPPSDRTSRRAFLAVLLTANVTWGRWVLFAIPGALLVSLVGLAGIVLSR